MQGANYAYPPLGSLETTIDLGNFPSLGSPNSHYDPASSTVHKRRKIDRACDACRRRKTKCDGSNTPDNVCTNCLQTKKSCTYVEASRPRGPPKAYITGLEDRMEKLEALLNELRPDVDFSSKLGPPVIRGSWKSPDSPKTSPNKHQRPRQPSPSATLQSAPKGISTPTPPKSAPVGRTSHLLFDFQPIHRRSHPTAEQHSPGEDVDNKSTDNKSTASDDSATSETPEIETVTGLVKRLTLGGTDGNSDEILEQNNRFHGYSSPVDLLEATRQFKLMHLQETTQSSQQRQSSVLQPGAGDVPMSSLTMRPQFWCPPQWEYASEVQRFESTELVSSVLAEFPPADLAHELIQIYFLRINSLIPLLHYGTFDRQWREKLHHRNIWFSTICLVLFAVASCFSDDPRVIKGGAKTASNDPDWKLAGRGYFEKAAEIHTTRPSIFYPAPLLEIQSLTLMAIFLNGTDNYPAAWILISIGIRKAQDIGAHRKNVYRNKPTVGEELWKRAFWCLIVLDRLSSAALGRGCGVGEEDFDVDMPLEVDDQYWEADDPALVFQQPAGIPANVCAFTSLIRLSQIIAFALRTVYAIDGSKIFSGLNSANWRTEVFEQLNTALSEWVASVPDHLVWPPPSDDLLSTAHAAVLQSLYHILRMLIYRPFISLSAGAPKNSAFPYPAMDICLEAARSCARIVEALSPRGLTNIPIILHAAHISASVLLVRVWDLKAQEKRMQAQGVEDFKPPLVQRIEPFLVDVNTFIRVLEWAEPRWGFVSSFLHQLRQSLPDSDDQPSPNTTDNLIYNTNPYPALPSQHFPDQSSTSEVPLTQSWQWQSHPMSIQPAHTARQGDPVQAFSPHLHHHTQYNPSLPRSIKHEYPSLSRSVEEWYETQQTQVPSSSSADRPVPYANSSTRNTTFPAYQGGGGPGHNGNHGSICPHPRTSELRPTPSQLQPAFGMGEKMTTNWGNWRRSGRGLESSDCKADTNRVSGIAPHTGVNFTQVSGNPNSCSYPR